MPMGIEPLNEPDDEPDRNANRQKQQILAAKPSQSDVVGLIPALRLLGDDWTVEEFALALFYGNIPAFETLIPADFVQDELREHQHLALFFGTFFEDAYSIADALQKYKFLKADLSPGIVHNFIAFNKAVVKVAEFTGDTESAERFLTDSLELGEIHVYHPFFGINTNFKRLEFNCFKTFYLDRLIIVNFGESVTIVNQDSKNQPFKPREGRYKERDEAAIKLVEEMPTLLAMRPQSVQAKLQEAKPKLFTNGYDNWWRKNPVFPKSTAGRNPK
ncbi:MAG: hypothetical protein WCP01_01845 [Methylococcaceae bacterium]